MSELRLEQFLDGGGRVALLPLGRQSVDDRRLLETFEVAPLSKVMYGSDAYHLPEFFYLGAKWAKRYVGAALGTLVEEGMLSTDDALRYARGILAENARGLHKLPRTTTS